MAVAFGVAVAAVDGEEGGGGVVEREDALVAGVVGAWDEGGEGEVVGGACGGGRFGRLCSFRGRSRI